MRTEVAPFPSAGHRVDLETWPRRAVFDVFSAFTEPYHGVCVRADCTETFRLAKSEGYSVFLSLVHRALAATLAVPEMRTRIVGGEVWQFDHIHGGSAVGRDDGTIGFGHYEWKPALHDFLPAASERIAQVKARTDLERYPNQDLIRFSVLPWLDFTSLSHARDFAHPDSAPRITFGKITQQDGRASMPVSLHAHHALADGLHVAQFLHEFERTLAEPLSA